ncbi:MAG: hypothetical protein GY842_25870 [bacterium]|nr:hypothetical protein [bacterium]
MGKRGPKRLDGLLWHKNRQQWYRRIGGQYRYFGNDEDAAYRAWRDFEAKSMIERVKAEVETVNGQALADLDDRIARLPDDVRHRMETTESLVEYEELRSRYLVGSGNDETPIGPTCQDVVTAYLEYCRKQCSPSHAGDAENRLAVRKNPPVGSMPTWLESIGPQTPIHELTRDHFKTYRDRLNRYVRDGKFSQSSVNKMFVLVKGSFRHAAEEHGWTTPAYLKILRTKKTDPTYRDIFEPADIAKMLKSFDAKFSALALLSLNAALSNADIGDDSSGGALRWADIDFRKMVLTFTRSKNKGMRCTPLWPRTIKALKAWREVCPDNSDDALLFPNDNGKPYIIYRRSKKSDKPHKNDYLSVAFRERFRELGMTYSFGIFRKSAATTAKRGTDADGVKMLLGDAAQEVWKKHYVMPYPENVKAGTDGIERHYFPKKKRNKKNKK